MKLTPEFTRKMRLLALNLTRKTGPLAAAAQLYRMYGHSNRSLFSKATWNDPLAPPDWPPMPPGVDDGAMTKEQECLAEQELMRMRNAGVHLTTWLDEEYPVNLRYIVSPPPVLYREGTLTPQDRVAVAIVGSRRASMDYIDFATRLGYELGKAGITVISGLARGIDRAAHEGALEAGGRTLAVLGTGIDVCYPKSHRKLAHRISESGALLTYFPMGTPPLPHHFPARNWVLSGLALITVVVQCGLKSGAIITAHYATAQGREVMAVPGYVHSALSQGTNALIKDGAGVVTDPQDVLDSLRHVLSFLGLSIDQIYGTSDDIATNSLSARIIEALEMEMFDVDAIASYLGEQVQDIQSELIRLELEGKVLGLPGGRFRSRFQSDQDERRRD